jgi:hypothetical protein
MASTNSTTLLTDVRKPLTTAPTAATKSKAIALEVDYLGMRSAAEAALIEARASLTILVAATDSADTNLATLNNIIASLS